MSYSNILVYVAEGEIVGDGLIKLPFIDSLHKAYPRAKITWCYGENESVYSGILAPLVHSKISEIITINDLKSQQFDLVIDTQSKLLATLKLKYYINSGKLFSPTLHYLFSDFKPPGGYKASRRLADKMLGFLEIIGINKQEHFQLSLDREWDHKAQELLPESKEKKGFIGLAVGAGSHTKCWPKESYMALARHLIQKGYQPVVILGPQEQDWIAAFLESLPEALYPLQDPRVLKQSPLLTIAIAKRFAAAVANDCGTGHMFAAANTPMLTLFGPTSAEKFAPKVSGGLILQSQDFGGNSMSIIPLKAVMGKLNEIL